MTAAASVSPNPNGSQSTQDVTNVSSAPDASTNATPPPQLLHPQQAPALQYATQYPMMPAPMVYQSYPGATHPGAYMTTTPHFAPAPSGAYPMYSTGQPGSGPVPGHLNHPKHSSGRGSSPTVGTHSIHSHSSNPASNLVNFSGSGNSNFEPSSRTTLWMGIDNWMDENYIRSLWMNAAGVEVNVKMIRDRYTGNPANYCFVDFPTYEQATQCVKLDGTPVPTLPETVWRLNWASGGGLHDTKAPEFSIFVGDIAADVTDDILLTTFSSRYPSTKTAKVVMDPATGNSRGFGFVRFIAEEDQQRALAEMNGISIGQRTIRVGHATPKHRHGPGAHNHLVQQLPGNQRNFHAGHLHHMTHPYPHGPAGTLGPIHPGNVNVNVNVPAVTAAAAAAAADPNNTTVFIGGLSHPVGEDEIRSLFASQGEITLVKIPPGKNCAFVSYARRDSAEKAINELNGFALGNNKVRLSWGRPNYTNNHPANVNHIHQPHSSSTYQSGGRHHIHAGGQIPNVGSSSGLPGAPGQVSGNIGYYGQDHSGGFHSGAHPSGFNTNQSGGAPYGVPHNAFAVAAAAQGMYPPAPPPGEGPSPYGYANNSMGPAGVYAAYPGVGNPGPIPSTGTLDGLANGEITH